jgi:hypothetical protein
MRKIILCLIFILPFISGFGQDKKSANYFGDQIIVDSISTVLIPISYDLNSSSFKKFGFGYYANIIFYNFKTDSSKYLFNKNSFIRNFNDSYSRYNENEKSIYKNMSNNWIFYFVKEDYNNNDHIDKEDPSILYVTDRQGDGLRPITPFNNNAVSINIFDKLGFALIKIQSDSNNDKEFDDDDEYYLLRLDLKTLILGNKIEIR